MVAKSNNERHCVAPDFKSGEIHKAIRFDAKYFLGIFDKNSKYELTFIVLDILGKSNSFSANAPGKGGYICSKGDVGEALPGKGVDEGVRSFINWLSASANIIPKKKFSIVIKDVHLTGFESKSLSIVFRGISFPKVSVESRKITFLIMFSMAIQIINFEYCLNNIDFSPGFIEKLQAANPVKNAIEQKCIIAYKYLKTFNLASFKIKCVRLKMNCKSIGSASILLLDWFSSGDTSGGTPYRVEFSF